ncbi:hypothetical protein SOCE26_007770 [Sorangium cellulosum]|uniref:Secreted protein n=1 Tax=Sorangium cellulosum TaxID=56 RepID=A0A2L0EJB5_SORCE|nr:hypothetical protein SOCE26_007770 [Sorangium cellulosum]
MRTTSRRIPSAALLALVLAAVPERGNAAEMSAGVSLGWIRAGTSPRLAVGPQAGISWSIERDLLFKVHDLCSFVPPIQAGGSGVYNHTSVAVGYAWKDVDVSAGPSVAVYLIPACGVRLCGRVAGIAVGGHAQVNVYVAGPLGVSVSANVDWISGSSLVLPSHVSATFVVGPVLRWSTQ